MINRIKLMVELLLRAIMATAGVNLMPINPKSILPLIVTSVLLAVSCGAQSKSLDVTAEVRACASIVADVERHSCFDQLGAKLSPPLQNASSAQPEQVQSSSDIQPKRVQSSSDTISERAESNTKPTVLPDDLGGTKFVSPAQDKVESYQGRITSCSKAGDGKHLFVFENGQIWKQVKSSKRRYKNCDFAVTVTKDMFGYKMAIEGKSGNIRINRKR
ncbi:MAG: hypothetical protein ACI9FR_003145 [Cryomorphaceae bacterium]|jgi:hypothetical protein